MFRLLVVSSTLWSLWIAVQAWPQDLQTGILMAAAQVKDTFDNGAAARYDKNVEILGAKWKNDMEIGFGDAIKQRRSISDSDSSSSSSESESESDDKKRRKRQIGDDTIVDDIKAMYRKFNV